MQAEPVRVFVVSDHPLVRDGLRLQLSDEITDVTGGRLICPLSSVPLRRRVSESADHSEADRTLDQAGAVRE